MISHAYDSIDEELIWAILQKDIPLLKREIEKLKVSDLNPSRIPSRKTLTTFIQTLISKIFSDSKGVISLPMLSPSNL